MTRSKETVTEEEAGEYIGFITTPIDESERIIPLLKRHGVTTFKCQTNDNWWTLVFPGGATKILQEDRGLFYLVRLSDGFQFEYIYPIFKKDKEEKYARFPQIIIRRDTE